LIEDLRLKIRKSKNGTYYIPGLSMKRLKLLDKKGRHRWFLSKDHENLYIE
jgi:hypothetical protein